MAISDPKYSVRLPLILRELAERLVQHRDLPNFSELVRKGVQNEVYQFIGRTFVEAYGWEKISAHMTQLAVTHVPLPMPD